MSVLLLVLFLYFLFFPWLRYNGYRTDPPDYRRVWALTRGATTANRDASSMKRSFNAPTQAVSVTFNKEGKVTKLTLGHLIDKTKAEKARMKKRPRALQAFGSALGKAVSGFGSLLSPAK